MFTQKLNLTFPVSWRQASNKELEMVAQVMMEESNRVTAFHPFDMKAVKTALFFLFTDIEICASINPSAEVEKQFYLCRQRHSDEPFLKRVFRRCFMKKEQPFPLYLYQIKEVVETQLKWLEQPSNALRFPYPEIRRHGVKFRGPAALMQDFSWQRYRFASDYMNWYLQCQNKLLQMQKSGNCSFRDLRKQYVEIDSAAAMFLATLFCRKTDYRDEETQLMVKDYMYFSNQSSDNKRFFTHFPEEQMQVIIFWWTGMHAWLKKQYPHCFKTSAVNSVKLNPLALYSRTTATLEKHLQLKERDVNEEKFSNIFQHLEDMAKENEEMERIKNK